MVRRSEETGAGKKERKKGRGKERKVERRAAGLEARVE